MKTYEVTDGKGPAYAQPNAREACNYAKLASSMFSGTFSVLMKTPKSGPFRLQAYKGGKRLSVVALNPSNVAGA